MSKHTPGPWFVWEGHAEVYAGVASKNTPGHLVGATRDPMPCVARCDDSELSECRQRANARLISAAPDLLAALESVAHERDFVVRCNDYSQEVVRAAIAKARGGK